MATEGAAMSVQLKETNQDHDYEPAEFTILFEDDKTKITSWRFDPGTETGWHHHTFDYVTIQKSGGRLKLESDDGAVRFVDYVMDRAAAYTAPIKHNATNVSDEEVRVIEIEYKK
jgi:quercetin dioxygenase-like cupin family protein